jgi:hypothetical protein
LKKQLFHRRGVGCARSELNWLTECAEDYLSTAEAESMPKRLLQQLCYRFCPIACSNPLRAVTSEGLRRKADEKASLAAGTLFIAR